MATGRSRSGRDKRAESDIPLLERVPPQSVEAEQAVLGSMLTEKEAIVRVSATLQPHDFYSPQHQALYGAILKLFQAGTAVDRVTLGEELRGSQQLEMIGGLPYLFSLQEAAPTAMAVRHYAQIVFDKSALRQQRIAWASYEESWYMPHVTAGDSQDAEERRAALLTALDLTSPDSLESIGIDELLGKDIEVEWLVEPLIPLNGVTVICGDSRLGKSWLALSLCHAVANSFPLWLGKYRIQRNGGALYLDNELGDAGMRARLLQFDLGSGIQTIVPVASEAEDPWAEETEESPGEPAEGRPLRLLFDPRVHTGQIGGLERLVRKVKARVVVLDPFADFIPPWTKLRDNDDMYREIQRLRRFAQRVHCAIIIVHHRRKFQPGMDAADHGSSVLGAQAILSRPDSCIMLLGQSDGPRIVNHDKARFSETVERSFYLEKVAGPDGRGVVLLHGGPVGGDESEKSELAAEVALAHLQVGQVRQFELVKAMVSEAKCGSRTAREVLLHMCADNRILKIALGGRQVAYELPSAL